MIKYPKKGTLCTFNDFISKNNPHKQELRVVNMNTYILCHIGNCADCVCVVFETICKRCLKSKKRNF